MLITSDKNEIEGGKHLSFANTESGVGKGISSVQFKFKFSGMEFISGASLSTIDMIWFLTAVFPQTSVTCQTLFQDPVPVQISLIGPSIKLLSVPILQ